VTALETDQVNPIPYPADMRRAVPAGARTPLRLVSSREPAEDDDEVGPVYGAAYVWPASEAEAEGWWG
jgi:hypothetical protein